MAVLPRPPPGRLRRPRSPVSRWAIRLLGSFIVLAGTLLMAYVGFHATAWAVSLFDTTLTAWWWFLLALPFGVVLSVVIGFLGSLWIARQVGNRSHIDALDGGER